MKITSGSTRIVVLVGSVAIKIPRFLSWQTFLWGLLANMQERTFSKAKWAELCPVLLADPLGFLVVMKRASPLSEEEFLLLDYQAFKEKSDYVIPVEHKRSSFGSLNGAIVEIDYGS